MNVEREPERRAVEIKRERVGSRAGLAEAHDRAILVGQVGGTVVGHRWREGHRD